MNTLGFRRPTLFVLVSLLSCLLIGGLCPSVRADVIELVKGGTFSGKWLNANEESPSIYRFETDEGILLTFESRQVRRVLRPIEKEEFYAKNLPNSRDDAATHKNMIKWCLDNSLVSLANAHRERLLEFEPDNTVVRAALDYIKIPNEGWVLESKHFSRLGMIKSEGKWKFPEEVAIETAKKKQSENIAKAGREFERYFFEATGNGRRATEALAYLKDLKNPNVVPKIHDMIQGGKVSQTNILSLIDLLGQIQTPNVVPILGELAITHPSPNIRAHALEWVKRIAPKVASNRYIVELQRFDGKKKSPEFVNRMGQVLKELGDKKAIPALIDTLITSHYTMRGPSGGDTQAGFNTQGGVNLTQGNKPTLVESKSENREILGALIELTGVNFAYNQELWKNWYAENHAKTRLILRRDP